MTTSHGTSQTYHLSCCCAYSSPFYSPDRLLSLISSKKLKQAKHAAVRGLQRERPQTGVKVFLALYIIGGIISSIVMMVASVLAGSALVAVEACLLFGVLVVVALCTIYALIKEKPALLWVFIIVNMISVVLCCVVLLLISCIFFFFNNEWVRQYIKYYAPEKGEHLSEDKVMEMMKILYAINVSIILVQLAYNSWVLHVLFGCKRYFEDKSKAKIMYSTYAAPRPNGKFPTHG